MKDEGVKSFLNVVSKYYPEKDIIINNSNVSFVGYLGGLLLRLLKDGFGERFTFVQYLIEYVEYRKALEITNRFIDDLVKIGVIYRDKKQEDIYRVSDKGYEIFNKVNIDERFCKN